MRERSLPATPLGTIEPAYEVVPPATGRTALWAMLWRHPFIIAAAAIVCGGTTALWLHQRGARYESLATVRVYEKTPELAAPEIVGIGATNDVDTEIEMMQSRTLMDAVVDSLGLALQPVDSRLRRSTVVRDVTVSRDATPRRLDFVRSGAGFTVRDNTTDAVLGSITPGPVRIAGLAFTLPSSALTQSAVSFDVIPHDEAVAAAQATLKVTRPSRTGDVIELRYSSGDPAIAQTVLNVLVDRFVHARQALSRQAAEQTAAFLRGQIQAIEAQRGDAEARLLQIGTSEGIVSLDDEAHAGVTEAADLKAQRDAANAEYRSISGLLATTKAASAADSSGASPYRSLIAFPELLKEQALTPLLAALSSEEDRRADLLTRRKPEDSDVQLLTARIHALEGQIRDIVSTFAASLAGQISVMNQSLSANQSELQQIPGKQMRVGVLQRQIKDLDDEATKLREHLNDAAVAAAVQDESVRAVDGAELPTRPTGFAALLVIAGTLFGLGIGAAIALVLEYRDRSVRTGEEVRLATGVETLGWIPTMARNARSIRGASVMPVLSAAKNAERAYVDPWVSDAYSQLQTNLALAEDGLPQVMLFASPLPGDGKTTTAANFAITLARRGRRVALVDADLRRGSIATLLHANRSPGLAEMLAGNASERSVRHDLEIDGSGALALYTAGSPPSDPVQLLESPAFHEFIARIRTEFELVVIDSSPVNIVPDALLVGKHVDGIVMVGRAGVTPYAALTDAVTTLQRAHLPVLGAVLNDINPSRDRSYGAMRWHEYGKVYYAGATASDN